MVCPLKSGKEADLFIVEHGPYHYVAKVYKERKFRSFKNDAGYREGRKVRNTRSQRALDKGTKYGQKLAEKAWHSAEADALRILESAGARVPRILAHHDRVLIMELIADDKGELAPQLAQVPFSKEGALEMYNEILEQVVLMLLNDLVHGDLSPYNVLVRDMKPVVIDMPQCISAAHNQQAGLLLERDVKAISQFLGLINPEIRAMGNQAWQLWVEYEAGTLTPEFRPVPGRERAKEVGDLEGLAEFVKNAAAEGDLERRAKEGDADAQALLRAADRREAKRARRIAQAAEVAAAAEAAEAEAKAKAERRTRKGQARADDRKRSRRTRAVTGGGRSKRKRGPKKEGAAPNPAPAAKTGEASGEQATKKKRRRRRRRKGPADGGGGRGNSGRPTSSS